MSPVLQTSRLILRPYAIEDFPAFAAMRADPRVMTFMGKGDLYAEDESWQRFLKTFGHWRLMGYGSWAVEEKASGHQIGGVGFADVKRPPEHAASGAPEMGWLFAGDVHGKGYATEAVRAALQWGREHFGAGARVVCVISTDNIASIRVAEKCGFKQFATATRYGLGRLVFERNL
jgi:RimJ/RimL family protein N-acetyltransferase